MGGIANSKAAVDIARRARAYGGKNPPLSKECGNCGKRFMASVGVRGVYAQFCSKSCKNIDMKTRQARAPKDFEKKCTICESTYFVSSWKKNTSRYCSEKCSNKGQYKSKIARHPEGLQGSLNMDCHVCGKALRRRPEISKSGIYTCSYKCMGISRLTDTTKGNHPSYVKRWFARKGKMSECEECGYNQIPGILVLHHRDRDRSNNTTGNLQVLCPNCHAIEHMEENKLGWRHANARREAKNAN